MSADIRTHNYGYFPLLWEVWEVGKWRYFPLLWEVWEVREVRYFPYDMGSTGSDSPPWKHGTWCVRMEVGGTPMGHTSHLHACEYPTRLRVWRNTPPHALEACPTAKGLACVALVLTARRSDRS